MFRAWLECQVPVPLGVACVRNNGGQDQILNFKTSTWVKLPDDGMPLVDQWIRATHYGPVGGLINGTYRVDLPEIACENYPALMVLELDGAGNILNRQTTVAIEILYRKASVTLSR